MKERNPMDRNDLNINKRDRVLEVGSGQSPHPRANVIVEKFIESNYHRGGDIRIFPYQEFVNADGENMPFKDKEFDYLICNQVLEHVEDPMLFTNELSRVASRGYIELPSFIGESLFPKESHKWVCLEIDKKLVLYDKKRIPSLYPDLGKTFLNFLPYQSFALHIFYLSYHQAHTVRYEWKDNIDIIVNPEDPYYKSFFEYTWSDKISRTIFPYRSKSQDIKISIQAFIHLVIEKIKRKFIPYNPVSLEKYMEIHKKNND
ncbi:class I SAM-dependent methyltransferase [Parabacteroides bouchesdurhonensis]|uniref:class I SAM-dependent methyltransferase n=1 Tax=Parabacteroides bouchesdurhonensis TaxID=1936995 RepID=UPI000E4CCDD1|nr:methyltransferase domain-containing protein [Parabacteroides bouchesdurhonensis]RHJ90401.1 class I SAM-dependent methyltransferase [Bacteroides sp. AM07-16]